MLQGPESKKAQNMVSLDNVIPLTLSQFNIVESLASCNLNWSVSRPEASNILVQYYLFYYTSMEFWFCKRSVWPDLWSISQYRSPMPAFQKKEGKISDCFVDYFHYFRTQITKQIESGLFLSECYAEVVQKFSVVIFFYFYVFLFLC